MFAFYFDVTVVEGGGLTVSGRITEVNFVPGSKRFRRMRKAAVHRGRRRKLVRFAVYPRCTPSASLLVGPRLGLSGRSAGLGPGTHAGEGRQG